MAPDTNAYIMESAAFDKAARSRKGAARWRRLSGSSRTSKFRPDQKKEIVEAVSSGRKTPAEIARLLKIHRATVSRIVSQARAGVRARQSIA